jgi:hypothetical protein
MTPPAPEWFVPLFVLVWLAVSAALSLMGGWHALAERFESAEPLEGDRFRFRSGQLGYGAFPVNYGACLFVTVGRTGFSLSVLFVFRFLHPRLVIPWPAVARCERVKYWLMNRVAVHIEGFDRRLLFKGVVGERILGAWKETA